MDDICHCLSVRRSPISMRSASAHRGSWSDAERMGDTARDDKGMDDKGGGGKGVDDKGGDGKGVDDKGMDNNGIIEVHDLRRRFAGRGNRGFEAVRGVNFSVRRGELFALLGTNGAGKTSTLRCHRGPRTLDVGHRSGLRP